MGSSEVRGVKIMELRDFDWSQEFLKVGSCSFRLLRERSAPAPSQAQLMPTAHNTGPAADWPLGAPGRFPVAWRLIWPAALCFIIIILLLLLFCLPSVPKWSFPIVAFPNKSKIKSMHGTRGRRGNIQKKQLNVVKLLTCSGLQVQVSSVIRYCSLVFINLVEY